MRELVMIFFWIDMCVSWFSVFLCYIWICFLFCVIVVILVVYYLSWRWCVWLLLLVFFFWVLVVWFVLLLLFLLLVFYVLRWWWVCICVYIGDIVDCWNFLVFFLLVFWSVGYIGRCFWLVLVVYLFCVGVVVWLFGCVFLGVRFWLFGVVFWWFCGWWLCWLVVVGGYWLIWSGRSGIVNCWNVFCVWRCYVCVCVLLGFCLLVFWLCGVLYLWLFDRFGLIWFWMGWFVLVVIFGCGFVLWAGYVIGDRVVGVYWWWFG